MLPSRSITEAFVIARWLVRAGVALSIGTIVGLGAIIGETWGREIEMGMEATEEFFRDNPFAREAAEKMSGMMHR